LKIGKIGVEDIGQGSGEAAAAGDLVVNGESSDDTATVPASAGSELAMEDIRAPQ
jgi:hypothetical protein